MRFGRKPKRVRESILSESFLALSLVFPPAGPTCRSLSHPTRKANKGSSHTRSGVSQWARSYTSVTLSYKVSSSDLEQLFSQYGSVQSATGHHRSRNRPWQGLWLRGDEQRGRSRTRRSAVSTSKSTTAVGSPSTRPSPAKHAPPASRGGGSGRGPSSMAVGGRRY